MGSMRDEYYDGYVEDERFEPIFGRIKEEKVNLIRLHNIVKILFIYYVKRLKISALMMVK
jgi:hypothetical protein